MRRFGLTQGEVENERLLLGAMVSGEGRRVEGRRSRKSEGLRP